MQLIDSDEQSFECAFCFQRRSVGVMTMAGSSLRVTICSSCIGNACVHLLNTRRRDAAAARYTAAAEQLATVRAELDPVKLENKRLRKENAELRGELGRADDPTVPLDVTPRPREG